MSEPETISADEYNARYSGKQAKPSKYKNVKTTVDGIEFDSRKEALRYAELKLHEAAGNITDLVLQPRFPVYVNGKKICTYVGDFAYKDRDGNEFIEDVKGVKTPAYNLKKKLMLAVHGIEIQEV